MFKRLIDGLFGGGDGKGGKGEELPATEYRGYLITPDPQEAGGQYRVSGWIRKPLTASDDGQGGETLEHRFERSDMVGSRDDCVELTVKKSQRLIDDLGDEIFTKR